jgi:acetoin utilization deacetylase AcuC-like enzyme
VKLYYCDHHEIPLPIGHKFPVGKYAMLRERLSCGGFEFEPAPFADPAIIDLVHAPAYVRAFLDGSVDARTMRRIGFPWSPELIRRTLASVGGTLSASRDALEFGVGGNLAGGTHHAFPTEGAGFCVFNDIAIAIRSLLSTGQVRRAAVLDLDVHQGDGTALIFADDPRVLTISLHAASNFPLHKQRSSIDVEFPDGACNEEYLAALAATLPRLFAFAPDILFYQAGVDALASDKLGRLALTPEGLQKRDLAVFEAAQVHGIPVVITLGGGYSEPIEFTVEGHANTFLAAAAIFENRTHATDCLFDPVSSP